MLVSQAASKTLKALQRHYARAGMPSNLCPGGHFRQMDPQPDGSILVEVWRSGSGRGRLSGYGRIASDGRIQFWAGMDDGDRQAIEAKAHPHGIQLKEAV